MSRTKNGLIESLKNDEDKELQEETFTLPRATVREQPMFQHQDRAVAQWERNGRRSGIVHLPTGSGKTRVALEIMSRLMVKNPDQRIIWASYGTPLIRQAMVRLAELGGLFPRGTTFGWEPTGTYLSGLFDQLTIVFLMREGLTNWFNDANKKDHPLREARDNGFPITVIYDECHQLGADGLQKEARKFFKASNASLTFIGFSATPLPTDVSKHKLYREHFFPLAPKTESAKPAWNMLVHHTAENRDLVRLQILCPINLNFQDRGVFDIPESIVARASGSLPAPRTKTPGKKDLQEFGDKYNSKVMSHPDVLRFLALQLAKYLPLLGKTLVFVPTIAAANMLLEFLGGSQSGKVSVVHTKLDEFSGQTLSDDRNDAVSVAKQISRFKKRTDPCIMINVGMLTTGFDDPKIQTIVLGRLTFSTNLFWQMIGRGTRGLRCGGTASCNVIDPIRLTDRFSYLSGYRPHLKLEDEEMEGEDDVGSSDSALDPHVPAVSRPTVMLSELPVTTKELTRKRVIAELLRKFLDSGLIDPAELSELAAGVAVRSVTTPDGSLQNEFVPAADAPDGAGYWLPEVMIARLEEQLRELYPRVSLDLLWLRSREIVPSDNSEDAMKLFQAKLNLIRKQKIATFAEFMKAFANLVAAHLKV